MDDVICECCEVVMCEFIEQCDNYCKKEGISKGCWGLLIVNIGKGKGKIIVVLGLMLWVYGWGLCVKMFQFFKYDIVKFGEYCMLDMLEIFYQGFGDGWMWCFCDLENLVELVVYGWVLVCEVIESGEYDLIVFDEFIYLFKYGWVVWVEVEFVLKNCDLLLYVIIMGCDVIFELIVFVDMVSEIQLVKYVYEQGIGGQMGIEY